MAVPIPVGQDVTRDFDQIRTKPAPVPGGKNFVHPLRLHAQTVPHQLVRLADELHIAVLDAVVHHLDIVPRAVFADPVAARRAVHLGRDRLEDRPDMRPRGMGPAGHDRGPEASPLLAAGNAGPDVEQAVRFDMGRPADRIAVIRVAAVDDDIARLQKRDQLFDETVHRRSGLDQHHHATRALEHADQFAQRMGAPDRGALGALGQELVDPGNRAVENRHPDPVVVHVQHEVLPHDRQPDQADIRFYHMPPFSRFKNGPSKQTPMISRLFSSLKITAVP